MRVVKVLNTRWGKIQSKWGHIKNLPVSWEIHEKMFCPFIRFDVWVLVGNTVSIQLMQFTVILFLRLGWGSVIEIGSVLSMFAEH